MGKSIPVPELITKLRKITGYLGPERRAVIYAAIDALDIASETGVVAMATEIAALREQLDAAQTALVDAETVKRERDALRGKIAKLRELAARPGDPCCLRLMRDMLAILDSGALAGGE